MSHRASNEEPTEYGPGMPKSQNQDVYFFQAVYSLKALVRVILFII
jgi:hypothetical protein